MHHLYSNNTHTVTWKGYSNATYRHMFQSWGLLVSPVCTLLYTRSHILLLYLHNLRSHHTAAVVMGLTNCTHQCLTSNQILLRVNRMQILICHQGSQLNWTYMYYNRAMASLLREANFQRNVMSEYEIDEHYERSNNLSKLPVGKSEFQQIHTRLVV